MESLMRMKENRGELPVSCFPKRQPAASVPPPGSVRWITSLHLVRSTAHEQCLARGSSFQTTGGAPLERSARDSLRWI